MLGVCKDGKCQTFVRVQLVEGLLAPSECGNFLNTKNFSWLFEGHDIGRRIERENLPVGANEENPAPTPLSN
jgi:hypothetical protein